jgi:hypothetical protein
MRTAYGIYRSLQVYLETYADDRELDEHFKSGVQLGAGLSSLMLSLLPSKVMKVSLGGGDVEQSANPMMVLAIRLPSSLATVEIVRWLSIHCNPLAGGDPIRVSPVFPLNRKESAVLSATWLCSLSILSFPP